MARDVIAKFWSAPSGALASGRRWARAAGTAIRRRPSHAVGLSDHLEAALRSWSQGVALFDENERLILWNDGFLDLLDMRRSAVRPGMTASALGLPSARRRGVEAGLASPQTLRALAAEKPSVLDYTRADGLVIETTCQSLPSGGFLLSVQDNTSIAGALTALETAQTSVIDAQAAVDEATRDAKAAHERLRAALDAVPQGLVLFDKEDRYVLWNRRYADLYVRDGDNLKPGMRFEEMLRAGLARGEYPDAVGREEDWLHLRLQRHRQTLNSHEQYTSDGRWVLVEERRTADGGSIGVRIDITDLKQQKASFELLFESNPIPMWVHDQETLEIRAVNKAALDYYGYTQEQFLKKTLLDIVPDWLFPPDTRSPGAPGGKAQGRTSLGRRSNGEQLETALFGQSLPYQGRLMTLMAAADMTERKRAESRIAFLAHHDPLTELPNRTAFAERLTEAIEQARRDQRQFAVLCLDLDQFKDANDVFGHAVGDELLKQVAKRLMIGVGPAFLARVGGDEFNVIMSDCVLGDAEAMGQHLLTVLSKPFDVQDQKLLIGLSVGVVMFPEGGSEAVSLLANADAALYRAKAAGRLAVRSFDPEMDRIQRDLQALQHDLRFALARGELVLHYQPQVRSDGTVFGFEALLRWSHPQRGVVKPDIFVTLAERNGLIGEIGAWVLVQACREAATWSVPYQVAVNLSPVQFRDRALSEQVAQILAQTALAPHRLELEVTESILIKDRDRALSILDDLKDLGVRVAMDDFGTGYSSLSSLKSFPFDKMKIDRSFVAEIGSGEQPAEVLRAIIAVAQALHIGVIAEGVETEAQRAFLANQGCHEMQGYLFGRPALIETYKYLTQRPGFNEAPRVLPHTAAA